MAGVLQHLRSSTLDKRPNPASMVDGQIAINYASGAPSMFFKDSNGSLVKVGPVHVGSGAPNAMPASGGTAGNSIGEQWLDTSDGTYVFKIWDGAAWRSEAGEFVNATGDTMTGDLVMNNANLVFEGSVDDGFETTLTVVNPTADHTITLPNVTGTVVTTGDSGTVTSTMIANSTIVNADISASAAIAGTKISPDFGSQTIQTTGIISAAAGSAAAPSVAFTGDTNTGIYSPGANQVAISTYGTGRLFVDSSGRLLVGTSSAYATSLSATALPIVQIHTNNSTDNSAVSQLMLTSWSAGTDVGPSFSLNRADSGAIGTFSPAIGSSDVIGNLRFNGSDGVKFIEAAKISAVADGTWGTDDGPARLVFSTTADGASSPTERMRIDSSGRAGIGTTSPLSRTHITSTSAGAGAIALRLENNSGTAGTETILQFAANSSNSTNRGAQISGLLESTNGTNLLFYTNPNSASPLERARIDSSGRLLVGTSTDAGGALLQVNGNRVRIATAKTPASASDTGTAGEICWDTSYIYVCTATNTWKRAALSTW